jgi:hypothetical protein
VTAPSKPMAITPSTGRLKGREPGGIAAADGDGLPDSLGFVDSIPDCDGVPLGSVTVVPKGVGNATGVAVDPGAGVEAPGVDVGLGVGRGVVLGDGGGVGAAVGGGVGAGVGVGAATTTGLGRGNEGFVPPLLTE